MKKIINYLLIGIIFIVITIILSNIYVILTTKNKIKNSNEISKIKDIDCIIILGAGIYNNKPKPMLEDRLLTGIELYNKNNTNKIIVSGDHGKQYYDEVNVMKEYLINKSIPSENIFMDHAGFSTYDSIYRAKKIFSAKKVVIVTQKYHLYRAIYIAKELGLEAYGVSSNKRNYQNQYKREIREVAARFKDYIKCIFKPTSTYTGEIIPVSGNGDITNDK